MFKNKNRMWKMWDEVEEEEKKKSLTNYFQVIFLYKKVKAKKNEKEKLTKNST